MACKKCKKDRPIVNKFHGLCNECNNMRLHGNIYGKQHSYIYKPKPARKTAVNKVNKKKTLSISSPDFYNADLKTTREKILEDEVFYEKCFNSSNHKCEECGNPLPEVFRDEDGKVIAKWRYSHIIAKSIAKYLRHKLLNINHLCQECHTKWDHGDKKSMAIYKNNALRFPYFFTD